MSDLHNTLQTALVANKQEIREWSQRESAAAPPPLYCSIDLRDAGYKIAPVDSNFFPAGFQHLCAQDLRSAQSIFRAQIASTLSTHRALPATRFTSPSSHHNAQKILLLPESHTHNAHYIENLVYLKQLVEGAGFQVEVGWLGALPAAHPPNEQQALLPPTTPQAPVSLEATLGKTLAATPVSFNPTTGKISAGSFEPELILLNHDFSGGYPAWLDQVVQPILPHHRLGWHARKKDRHFFYYNQLVQEFAALLKLDPWPLSIDSEEVSPVDFQTGEGLAQVAEKVDQMIARLKHQYQHYGITQAPFVFIKNNAGTYGMGIMVAHSGAEIQALNRRQKNKMSVAKNHSAIRSVILQEGVPTNLLIDRLVAEPVIYLAGRDLIGGFLRTHTVRGREDNLNSQGMVFRKLCMSDLNSLSGPSTTPSDSSEAPEPQLELVYGAIATLSALAAGREIQAYFQEQQDPTRRAEPPAHELAPGSLPARPPAAAPKPFLANPPESGSKPPHFFSS